MPLDYEKLAAAFATTGLTLEEAGIRMGWPKPTARQNMSSLIKGRATGPKAATGDVPSPRLDTVEKLCALLECPLVDLLTPDSPARGPAPRRGRSKNVAADKSS